MVSFGFLPWSSFHGTVHNRVSCCNYSPQGKGSANKIKVIILHHVNMHILRLLLHVMVCKSALTEEDITHRCDPSWKPSQSLSAVDSRSECWVDCQLQPPCLVPWLIDKNSDTMIFHHMVLFFKAPKEANCFSKHPTATRLLPISRLLKSPLLYEHLKKIGSLLWFLPSHYRNRLIHLRDIWYLHTCVSLRRHS